MSRTTEPPHFESRLNSACRIVVAQITKPNEKTPKQRGSDSLYLFRSYKIGGVDPYYLPRNFGWKSESIWTVCRATIADRADPTFFEANEGYVSFDGSSARVNPTSEALEEIFRLHKKPPRISASFGAGRPPPVSPSRARGDRFLLRTVLEINRRNTLLSITDTTALRDCESVHRYVQGTGRQFVDDPKSFQYFRFNVEEDLGNVPFDECKTNRDDGMGGKCSTFGYIRRCTDMELAKPQVQEQLRELATQLVKQRRQRIRDDPDRWERFACCTVYICSDDECRNDGKGIFNLRREMRAHLQIIHKLPEGEQGQELETKLDECRKLPEHPGGPF